MDLQRCLLARSAAVKTIQSPATHTENEQPKKDKARNEDAYARPEQNFSAVHGFGGGESGETGFFWCGWGSCDAKSKAESKRSAGMDVDLRRERGDRTYESEADLPQSPRTRRAVRLARHTAAMAEMRTAEARDLTARIRAEAALAETPLGPIGGPTPAREPPDFRPGVHRLLVPRPAAQSEVEIASGAYGRVSKLFAIGDPALMRLPDDPTRGVIVNPFGTRQHAEKQILEEHGEKAQALARQEWENAAEIRRRFSRAEMEIPPAIARGLPYAISGSSGSVRIQMPLVRGRTLFKTTSEDLRPMSDEAFDSMVREFVEGIIAYGNLGLRHNDIHQNNIIVNPVLAQMTLIDWGLAHMRARGERRDIERVPSMIKTLLRRRLEAKGMASSTAVGEAARLLPRYFD